MINVLCRSFNRSFFSFAVIDLITFIYLFLPYFVSWTQTEPQLNRNGLNIESKLSWVELWASQVKVNNQHFSAVDDIFYYYFFIFYKIIDYYSFFPSFFSTLYVYPPFLLFFTIIGIKLFYFFPLHRFRWCCCVIFYFIF